MTVLERGNRLLSRQIDARASEIVHAYFEAIGMTVLYGAETVGLQGDPVNAALLKDGRVVPCGVFLGAIGIRPNTELAAEAGLTVNRGVVVDDRMETSSPGVYAAGDVAEHNGMLLGLWPIAAKQGEVAAMNALGGSESLTAEVPACILKGAGIDLSSIGRFEPEEGEELIVADNGAEQSYRRGDRDRSSDQGRPGGGRPPGGLLGHTGRHQEAARGHRRHGGRPAGRRLERPQGRAAQPAGV